MISATQNLNIWQAFAHLADMSDEKVWSNADFQVGII